jgi:hypothetical protein
MGSLPIYRKNIWGDFLYLGTLLMYGKTPHVWEDVLCMGRVANYGKTSHTLSVIPLGEF